MVNYWFLKLVIGNDIDFIFVFILLVEVRFEYVCFEEVGKYNFIIFLNNIGNYYRYNRWKILYVEIEKCCFKGSFFLI